MNMRQTIYTIVWGVVSDPRKVACPTTTPQERRASCSLWLCCRPKWPMMCRFPVSGFCVQFGSTVAGRAGSSTPSGTIMLSIPSSSSAVSPVFTVSGGFETILRSRRFLSWNMALFRSMWLASSCWWLGLAHASLFGRIGSLQLTIAHICARQACSGQNRCRLLGKWLGQWSTPQQGRPIEMPSVIIALTLPASENHLSGQSRVYDKCLKNLRRGSPSFGG